MRILQVLHTDESGGIRTLANMIAAGLRQHGFAVETCFLYPRQGASRLQKLVSALRMAWRLIMNAPDALIAYQATASILAGSAGCIGGSRIRIVHQTAVPGATAWPLQWLDKLIGSLGGYTANVMNSRATAAAFDRYPAAYRRHMVLIEHGIDPPRPRRDRAETRREFKLPPGKFIALNIGRLTGQKNQKVLIHALAQVPGAVLAIAAGGPLLEEYQKLAGELGVRERLFLLGDVSTEQVADLLRTSDLFVFPSVWETFGLAAVEAAMAGTPVVASDLPVLREVLDAGGNDPVIFVAAGDADGWAKAIAERINNPVPASVLSVYAESMQKKYAKEKMIERYLTLLNGGAS